jgi:hypothetical protein
MLGVPNRERRSNSFLGINKSILLDLGDDDGVYTGLGRMVALHHRASTSYQIR